MGTLFVDKLDPQSGTSLELGSSGDTVAVNTGATTNLAGNVTLGASGKTITVPAGATIVNSGTATGFGGTNTACFVATKGSYQTTVADNVYTQVTYTNEISDADNCFASSTFTAPSSGLYHFYASVTLGGHTAVSYHYVTVFYKNGSELADYRSTYMDDNAESQQFQCPISGTISLAQNDTIKVYAKVNTTSGDVEFLDGVFGGYKLIT